MKKYILILTTAITVFTSCNICRNINSNVTKKETITIPAKSDFSIWKGLEHCSFTVTLENENPSQSCEVFYVRKNGKEKWINPSLLPKTSLQVSIAKDGYLILKNFNPNEFSIQYTINN
jgi:hypothetical protein